MRSRIINISVFGMVAVLVLGCQMNQNSTNPSEDEKWRRASLNEWMPEKEAHDPKLLPVTHFASAHLLEKGGRLVEAARQYEMAIALNHDYAEAYNRLGMVLGRLGRHQQADEALQQAVRLRPENGTYVNNLGFSYLLQRRYQDAEQMFSEALLIDPGIVLARMNLGIALANQGLYEDSLYHFRQVLPEADAQYNVGLFCMNAGLLDAADRHFRMACSADPAHHAALRQIEELGPRLAWRQSSQDMTANEQSLFSRPVTEGAIAQRSQPPAQDRIAATRTDAPPIGTTTSDVDVVSGTTRTTSIVERPAPVPVTRDEITVIRLDEGNQSTPIASDRTIERQSIRVSQLGGAGRPIPGTNQSKIEPCEEEYIEEDEVSDIETTSPGWHLTSAAPQQTSIDSESQSDEESTSDGSWFVAGDGTEEAEEGSGWNRAPAVMPIRSWEDSEPAPAKAAPTIAERTSETSTPIIVSVPRQPPIQRQNTATIAPSPQQPTPSQPTAIQTPPRPGAIQAPATPTVSEIYEFDGATGSLRLISKRPGAPSQDAGTINTTPGRIPPHPIPAKTSDAQKTRPIRTAEPASYVIMRRPGPGGAAPVNPHVEAIEPEDCTGEWLRDIGHGIRAAAAVQPTDDDVSSDFIVTAHIE